jgi:hypothetical protein
LNSRTSQDTSIIENLGEVLDFVPELEARPGVNWHFMDGKRRRKKKP